MTREQIEQAAKESADEELDDFECRGHRDGFIAGAQWRINSVWHDASEEQERKNEYILVEYKEWGMDGSCYDVTDDLDRYKKRYYSNIVRWAYVEDLLPERKEEAINSDCKEIVEIVKNPIDTSASPLTAKIREGGI